MHKYDPNSDSNKAQERRLRILGVKLFGYTIISVVAVFIAAHALINGKFEVVFYAGVVALVVHLVGRIEMAEAQVEAVNELLSEAIEKVDGGKR